MDERGNERRNKRKEGRLKGGELSEQKSVAVYKNENLK